MASQQPDPAPRTSRASIVQGMPVRWPIPVVLVGLVVPLGISLPTRAASPQEVDAALKRGAAFLWSQQQPAGNWEADPVRKGETHDAAARQGDTWGGYSALGDVRAADRRREAAGPAHGAGGELPRAADIIGTYSLGMRCQVWYLLPPTPETRRLMQEDAARLLSGLGADGTRPDVGLPLRTQPEVGGVAQGEAAGVSTTAPASSACSGSGRRRTMGCRSRSGSGNDGPRAGGRTRTTTAPGPTPAPAGTRQSGTCR